MIGHGLHSFEVVDVRIHEGHTGHWGGCHLRGEGGDAALLALGLGAELFPVAVENGECLCAGFAPNSARLPSAGDR